MTTRILIMGLPGAGKTTLANEMMQVFISIGRTCEWYNADKIRDQFNDWDFSMEGRLRQSQRMKDLSEQSDAEYVICDFIAPTNEIRKVFNADYTVWINTSNDSLYEDTTQIFEPPTKYNYYVDQKNSPKFASLIIKHILYLQDKGFLK